MLYIYIYIYEELAQQAQRPVKENDTTKVNNINEEICF